MGARRIDLQVGEADLTSEGQMSLVMEETRRVIGGLDESDRVYPIFVISGDPTSWMGDSLS